jgi:DNA-binding transcriptional MerR regulator
MAGPVKLPEDQDQFKLNEVCKLANVQPYMLRFWGTEFPQLEAGKSTTGQRLYSREQVDLILEIRRLLFDEGLTIAGARKKVAAMEEGGEVEPPAELEVELAPDDADRDVSDDEEDGDAVDEPAPVPVVEKKSPPPKAVVKTSSARRTTKKKAEPAKVDKTPAADVQPLLATLKNVRDEIHEIVTELKGE